MKKMYESPELKISLVTDVIITSGCITLPIEEGGDETQAVY